MAVVAGDVPISAGLLVEVEHVAVLERCNLVGRKVGRASNNQRRKP
uniref:Uncharacterized protein n=1 Tax=Peronospora matthiolae TaxID=2874970 RepID=A0AAV1T5Q0_9STRA